MKNIDELISKAKEIEDDEERIRFVMNYFLKNTRYDYVYLFVRGYSIGTVSAISKDLEIDINKTRAEEDAEYSLTRSIVQGESRFFNDILQLRDTYCENYSEFIEKLKQYIMYELRIFLGNETIARQSSQTIIKKIEEGLREKEKSTICDDEGEYEIEMNYDISKVITDFFLEPKKFFPPTFNNGIITSGVCADFSIYLVPILQKMGIEAHRVDGTSDFLHSWIIVKIGDELKSIDLARAIATRDNIRGIPSDQTSQDWLYCSMEKMFAMQENRTITSIDGITLPTPIISENYDEQQFINLIAQITQGNVKDNTLKKIVGQALRGGISIEDSKNAELSEKVEEGKENEH